MPCYQINTIKVEFNMKHFSLLEKAVQSLKWKIRAMHNGFAVWDEIGKALFTVINGETTVRESDKFRVNALKCAYSKEAIKYAAQKAGWVKQQKGDKTSYVKKQF